MDACSRAGIGDGATVIDVGCGPLGALAALSRVVGSAGTVVGVDANRAALDKARLLVPHVRFVHADVHEVDLEEADLVYSRLMLLHQADPLHTLRCIAKLLRPGGVMIAHEPSNLAVHAPASEPAVAPMTRVWELVIAAARARGARTDFGRKGRGYLRQAGFEVMSHRAYAVHYPPEIGYDIPRVALHSSSGADRAPACERRGDRASRPRARRGEASRRCAMGIRSADAGVDRYPRASSSSATGATPL